MRLGRSQLWSVVFLLCLLVAPAGSRATAEPTGSPLGTAALSESDSPAQNAVPAGPVRQSLSPVQQAWFDEGRLPRSRAFAARKAALEVGLHEASGPARALIAPALRGGQLAEALLAVKLAPNLPLARVSLAAVYWRDGDRLAALRALGSAAAAVPRNLEATLWLADTLLVLLVGVLLIGSLSFIALVALRFVVSAAHDLGDLVSASMPGFARGALLASIVLAPFALGEGLLGAVIVLFGIGFLYGETRHRTMLALGAVLLLLALVPLSRTAGRVLAMPTADPVATAAFAVRQGVQDPGDVALLARVESVDLLAAQALAAHARQRGQVDEAFERYQRLVERRPGDPVATNNLANLHFRSGDLEEAVALYEAASRSLDSPIVSFNLSQALARRFEMEPFEAALRHAQQLGGPIVAELSQQNDPGFVADLPISLAPIRARMFDAAEGSAFALALRAPLAPGRLGVDWQLPACLLTLVSLVGLLVGRRFETSGSCSRCGVRVCGRCDPDAPGNGTCNGCDRLFRHPEQTDAGLRAVRLEELSRRAARLRRASRAASAALPGFGGMVTGRPDHSLVAILCFGWMVAGLFALSGVVPDPLVMGAIGPLLVGSTVMVAGLGYLWLVLASIRNMRST